MIQKFKQSNVKIRFQTGERLTSEAGPQSTTSVQKGGAGLKIRSLANPMNKNFVIKPSSIIGANQNNYSSVQSVLQRPKNIMVVPPMSEQEYNDKKE